MNDGALNMMKNMCLNTMTNLDVRATPLCFGLREELRLKPAIGSLGHPHPKTEVLG